MGEDRKESQGFRVRDRRMFTEEGEERKRDEAETRAREPEPPKQSPPTAAEGTEPPPAQMDFSSFILSLATTTMVHLGEVPDPMKKGSQENLAAARQMVDILGILKEKTEGNRTEAENSLLEQILYELRMKVLAKSKVIQL